MSLHLLLALVFVEVLSCESPCLLSRWRCVYSSSPATSFDSIDMPPPRPHSPTSYPIAGPRNAVAMRRTTAQLAAGAFHISMAVPAPTASDAAMNSPANRRQMDEVVLFVLKPVPRTNRRESVMRR
ncbi:hypothetical protein BDW71DRAFT_82739 [Aspergillus fruticulosus]